MYKSLVRILERKERWPNQRSLEPSDISCPPQNQHAEPSAQPQEQARQEPAPVRSVVPTGTAPVSEWILAYCQSDAYRSLVDELTPRLYDGAITDAEETALIYALIQYLGTHWCLEIGTLFGHTTRVMAEAAVNGSGPTKVITIDPFGAERVPSLLAAWPAPLQAVVEYRPITSMDFFLDLEVKNIPKGSASPLGLVFVDGHHGFEFALYDIIRSADHVRPGGVIAVDNLEQDGPKNAVLQFLLWHPAWRLFFDRQLWDATIDVTRWQATNRTFWGLLLSPTGLEVAGLGYKLMHREASYQPLRGLRFNIAHVSHPGTLHINFLYVGIPHDFHRTGTRIEQIRVIQRLPISAAIMMTAPFDTLAELPVGPDGFNFHWEVDLRYESSASDSAYLLLDAREPVSVMPVSD
jgi:predicted O-methyltransferase YrrM